MVALIKRIDVPTFDQPGYPNLRANDGSILNIDTDDFGGIYATNLLLPDPDELQETSGRLLRAWIKAYKSDLPKNDSIRMLDLVTYASVKNKVDALGPIKVFDSHSMFNVFDSFECKYVDANENLGPETYRFKMLNPIYNKVGNWWLGDKGQPIMAVPNNMDSYDSEPVVPKSYDDYFTYTDTNKKLIDKANDLIEKNIGFDSLGTKDSNVLYSTIVAKFGYRYDSIPGYAMPGYKSDKYPLLKDGTHNHDKYRLRTPLEFMSPYNPDVLVPEDKLNELAKEHPEVWKPMIFKYKGYKSICVSANGYIISAYQPAPNVFLPIHIYGVSDHRGPDGYDAAKSVIITIEHLSLPPDESNIYNIPDEADTILINSDTVKKAYDDMMKAVRQ